MLRDNYELIIIGGGPAGLGAALGAKALGLKKILLVERQPKLGGVLFQCIHMGFGSKRFNKNLSGPEYADILINQVKEAGIDIMTDTSVIKIEKNSQVVLASRLYGVISCRSKAIILATGCREKPIGTLDIAGSRPSGIFTAGAVQKMINIHGYDVGKKVLVLGSGDLGLIIARRLKILGKEVLGVIEQYPNFTGLLRNKIQCLDDFEIPLITGHTIVEVLGQERISGVKICPVDKDLSPNYSKMFQINCDTLITAAGMLPETDLLDNLNLKKTDGGIWVNKAMQTSIPWLFICGNAQIIHNLVDNATAQGENAGKNAASFIMGIEPKSIGNSHEYTGALSYNLKANELICTICPKSCILAALEGKITGNECDKGLAYAGEELHSSMQYLTSTVAIKGQPHCRLPVRSSKPVTKDKIPTLQSLICKLEVCPPLNPGDIIIRDIDSLGVDIIASTKI